VPGQIPHSTVLRRAPPTGRDKCLKPDDHINREHNQGANSDPLNSGANRPLCVILRLIGLTAAVGAGRKQRPF